jgi:hypothetical protein
MTAPILKHAADWLTAIATKPRHTQLTPSSAIEHVENTDTRSVGSRSKAVQPSIDPLENPLENPLDPMSAE